MMFLTCLEMYVDKPSHCVINCCPRATREAPLKSETWQWMWSICEIFGPQYRGTIQETPFQRQWLYKVKATSTMLQDIWNLSTNCQCDERKPDQVGNNCLPWPERLWSRYISTEESPGRPKMPSPAIISGNLYPDWCAFLTTPWLDWISKLHTGRPDQERALLHSLRTVTE